MYLNKVLENENVFVLGSLGVWLSLKNSFNSTHLLNMCGAPEDVHTVKGREKCFHSTLGILTIFIILAYN